MLMSSKSGELHDFIVDDLKNWYPGHLVVFLFVDDLLI